MILRLLRDLQIEINITVYDLRNIRKILTVNKGN